MTRLCSHGIEDAQRLVRTIAQCHLIELDGGNLPFAERLDHRLVAHRTEHDSDAMCRSRWLCFSSVRMASWMLWRSNRSRSAGGSLRSRHPHDLLLLADRGVAHTALIGPTHPRLGVMSEDHGVDHIGLGKNPSSKQLTRAPPVLVHQIRPPMSSVLASQTLHLAAICRTHFDVNINSIIETNEVTNVTSTSTRGGYQTPPSFVASSSRSTPACLLTAVGLVRPPHPTCRRIAISAVAAGTTARPAQMRRCAVSAPLAARPPHNTAQSTVASQEG